MVEITVPDARPADVPFLREALAKLNDEMETLSGAAGFRAGLDNPGATRPVAITPSGRRSRNQATILIRAWSTAEILMIA
jgi:hypothetical protein